ncbi:MAG: NAD-dependent epimerase/dehydratase family protein [Lachnospiraceae bacterium]|nr:NAD-dependent epimerase/dehydratase family protein [Lachnospiraceae bacterium]
MIDLYSNDLYIEDIKYVLNLNLPWDKLKGKKILISGATGLVGSFFVDVIMYGNQSDLACTIYALSRNEQKAIKRFSKWIGNSLLKIISHDIKKPLERSDIDSIDYVIHMASNTHPLLYSTDPVGTITTNIIGLKNMLDFAVDHSAKRFVFTSSNEIYGENRGDLELFSEEYCGYIDCNTLRAGYPESKRCGEALCQAYMSQEKLDIVIPRITRTYGPTMSMSDTKAVSQFIINGIKGENIVLKSDGSQYYSYTYVTDAVSGMLYIILKGICGEAYNIADVKSDICLKDLAEVIANISGKRVVYEIPNNIESAGYSRATKARLDGNKLIKLGWTAKYDINTGIKRTLEILKTKG